MEPGNPDVMEQLPAGGNPMKPNSGTYGDVADLERLKSGLRAPGDNQGDGSGAAAQPAPIASPGAQGGRQVPSPDGGVPGVLMGPSSQPGVPSSTPLSGPGAMAGPGAASAAQRRLAVLDALSKSDQVSEEAREWAALVLKKLASRGS